MKKNDFMKVKKKKRRRKKMEGRNGRKPVNLGSKPEHPKKEHEVSSRLMFTFYNTNPPSIRVEGIPPDLQVALRQMNAATELVVRMFVDKGRAGLLDDKYRILEDSSVVPVETPILGLDGKKLN